MLLSCYRFSNNFDLFFPKTLFYPSVCLSVQVSAPYPYMPRVHDNDTLLESVGHSLPWEPLCCSIIIYALVWIVNTSCRKCCASYFISILQQQNFSRNQKEVIVLFHQPTTVYKTCFLKILSVI